MKYIYIIPIMILTILALVLVSSQADAKSPKSYYVVATDTIVVVDGTSTYPANMSMLFNNNSVHGWGQVTKLGMNSFRIDANFQIGNSTSANTTYFKSVRESITIEKTFKLTTYATVKFGEWYMNGGPHASNGSCVRLNQTVTVQTLYSISGQFEAYGSMFTCRPYYHEASNSILLDFLSTSVVRINESKFSFFTRLRFYSVNTMVYNSWAISCGSSWAPNVVCSHMWNYVHQEYSSYTNANARITIWNMDCYGNSSSLSQRYGFTHSGTAKVELINPTPVSITLGYSQLVYIDESAGTDSSHYFRINFTFDVNVVDSAGNPIQGALVRIWNRTDRPETTLQYSKTTNVQGNVTQSMLPYLKAYSPSPDWGNPRVNESYAPYRVIINKTGYQSYNYTFNRSEPINWTIVLQPECSTSTPSVSTSDYDDQTWLLIPGFLIGMIVGPMIWLERKKKRSREQQVNDLLTGGKEE